MNVEEPKGFAAALSKVVIEFKDIKDIEWNVLKSILEGTSLKGITETSYRALKQNLQDMYFFDSGRTTSIKTHVEALFGIDGNQ